MAQLVQEVRPGEIISSARWNELVTSINHLNAKLDTMAGSILTGTVTVPSVFGLKLIDAENILNDPTIQLNLGTVIDAFGNIVSAIANQSRDMIVINQLPAPGTLVFPGSSVNIVVAAKPGSGARPPQLPTIVEFRPLKTPIGETVEIVGENFHSDRNRNRVTFNGISAGTPLSTSTIFSLHVNVPTGISGAPTLSGQELSVTVKVVTPEGEVTAPHTILPPIAGPAKPKITSITPNIPSVGGPMTITGENFGTNLTAIVVRFDEVRSETPTSASATQLVVPVPNGIPGLSRSSDLKFVNIVVSVTGRDSDPFPQNIQVL